MYKKFRELKIDPFSIDYKNITLKKIISYYPAGNDVLECVCSYNNKIIHTINKYERSRMADFDSEVNNITILKKNNYYKKTPNIIEYGICNNIKYIIEKKEKGKRISEIIKQKEAEKKEILEKYGNELSIIHKIPIMNFKISKKRDINYIVKKYDFELNKYVNYLKNNKIKMNDNTFIHGDFHYANLLWYKNNINVVLDYEYSGLGFKEQDIAWSCILRPGQEFMDNINDIVIFLNSYKKENNFDFNYFKWCYINGMCHFYMMNKDNDKYLNKILNLLENILDLQM